MRQIRFGIVSVLILAAAATSATVWADPCQSGLQPGQRPGPYSFLVTNGPKRGQSHCFVCETADRPAVIVFARTVSDPLARLLQEVDQATIAHQKVELRGWATFLHDSQPVLEPKLTEWTKDKGFRNVAVGVFEDVNGPPSYRINREADVTVLLSVKQKVVANFAYRQGELSDEQIKAILAALPHIIEGAKK